MQPISQSSLIARTVWEAFLLVVAVMFVLLVVAKGGGRPVGSELMAQLALVGLPATALALSMRTGTPNLAVGGIGAIAGLMAAKMLGHGWSWWAAAPLTIIAALVAGAILALVIALLDAPGWVVSLGLLAVLSAISFATATGGPITILPDGAEPHQPRTVLELIAVLTILGSLAGGALWLVPGVRRALGADRPVESTFGQRLPAALAGFAGSSAIAAIGGLASLIWLRSVSTGGFSLPLVPLAAVLLGGVSMYGRRGGVAGTVLATVALVGLTQLLGLHAASLWLDVYLPAIIAIAVGIMVSAGFRALERPVRTVTYEPVLDQAERPSVLGQP